jgi:hypothetical protein
MKGKVILVTGLRGPCGSEPSGLPHCLGNRFKDGGEVGSLTRRSAGLYPRKIPDTHFC